MDTKDIQILTQFSRLSLTSEEQEAMKEDLKKILELIKPVREMDTSSITSADITKSFFPPRLTKVQRTDVIDPDHENSCIEEIKSLSPEWEAGYFVVPAVIE